MTDVVWAFWVHSTSPTAILRGGRSCDQGWWDENQGSRNATSKPTALGPSRNKLLTAYMISNLEGR